jgi:hypothetical protein
MMTFDQNTVVLITFGLITVVKMKFDYYDTCFNAFILIPFDLMTFILMTFALKCVF